MRLLKAALCALLYAGSRILSGIPFRWKFRLPATGRDGGMQSHQVRSDVDRSYDKINGKIQRAEQMKVHSMFVIGKRDMEADAVSVRVHGEGNLGAKPRAEVIAEIVLSIKERRAVKSDAASAKKRYFVSAARLSLIRARIPAARCESGSALAD